MVLRLLAELEVEGGPGRPGSTPGSCPGAVATLGAEVLLADDLRFEPRPRLLRREFIEFIEIVAGYFRCC